MPDFFVEPRELERVQEIKALGFKPILSCPHCTLRLEVRAVGLVHASNGKRECREGSPYVAERPRVVAK